MLDTTTFFATARIILWVLRIVPVGLAGLIVIVAGLTTVEAVRPTLGFATFLIGWIAIYDLCDWLYYRDNALWRAAVRVTAAGNTLLAYLSEGGLRTYVVTVSYRDRQETICLPSLLEVSVDRSEVPTAEWEITVEGD